MNTTQSTEIRLAIIGCGNMGGALLKGWVSAQRKGLTNIRITATAKTTQTLESIKKLCPEVTTTTSNTEAVANADVVILAIKPWFVANVLDEIRDTLYNSPRHPFVLSVVANMTSKDLSDMLDNQVPCVYAMPNIAAEFGESMTFVEETADTEITNKAAKLLNLVGKTQIVPPRLMAPGMMMAGCGIAYVMRFLRAMTEGGVEMGIYPKDAKEIAMQTMQGAVTLLTETGLHPEAAIDRVTTPGGITIRGLNELDHQGFNSAVIRCLKAGLQ